MQGNFTSYSVVKENSLSYGDDWISVLEDHGWVSVEIPDLTEDDVLVIRTEFFRWLKSCSKNFDENDFSTWTKDNLPVTNDQQIYMLKSWIGHEEFFWGLREKCYPIFCKLWKTKDLLTSFDGGSIAKPREYVPWFHTDQLDKSHPCIQGMVNLFDSKENDGGLIFLEKSHLLFDEYVKDHPKEMERWSLADLKWKQFQSVRAIKPCVKAGTILLWDSRLFHCGSPPVPEKFENPRLCLYISMVPKHGCDEKSLETRRMVFEKKQMTGHIAYSPGFVIDDKMYIQNSPKVFPNPKMNDLRKMLIG